MKLMHALIIKSQGQSKLPGGPKKQLLILCVHSG